jgi:hypothetical protein
MLSIRVNEFGGPGRVGVVRDRVYLVRRSDEMLSQSTPPAARGSGIYAGQNMEGAPTATRTRDLPLRRRSLYPLSYRGLRNPHATWDGARSLPSARRPMSKHPGARPIASPLESRPSSPTA